MSDTRRNPGFGIRPFDRLRAAPSNVEGRDSGLDARGSGFCPSTGSGPPRAMSRGGTRDSHDTVNMDAAIDVVAREMTDREPSGALRARVLERIRPERRRAAHGVPRRVMAAAAVSLLVIVATTIWFASRRDGQTDEPGAIAASPASATPGSETVARGTVVPLRVAVGSSPSASRVRSGLRHQPSAPTVSRDQAEEPAAIPLVRLDPIPNPPPVQIPALSIESVGVSELIIQPIQIAPLDAGRGPEGESGR